MGKAFDLDPAFVATALEAIAAAQAQVREATCEEPWCGELLAEKTWSFASYTFVLEMAAASSVIEGICLKDNGFKYAKPSRWLRAATIRTHEWVDRKQCGEYQLLAEVCEKLSEHVNLSSPLQCRGVRGTL